MTRVTYLWVLSFPLQTLIIDPIFIHVSLFLSKNKLLRMTQVMNQCDMIKHWILVPTSSISSVLKSVFIVPIKPSIKLKRLKNTGFQNINGPWLMSVQKQYIFRRNATSTFELIFFPRLCDILLSWEAGQQAVAPSQPGDCEGKQLTQWQPLLDPHHPSSTCSTTLDKLHELFSTLIFVLNDFAQLSANVNIPSLAKIG